MATFSGSNPLLQPPSGGADFVDYYGELGDVLTSSLWPGPQTIVRHWHIRPIGSADALSLGRRDPPPGGHKVSLRHGPSGSFCLILDGQCIRKGYEGITVRSFSISFSLPDRRPCSIECVGTSTIGFNHSFRLEGLEIAELRTVLDPSLGESLPRRAGIADTRVFHEGKKKITVYQLFVEPGNTDGTLLIERRYSEFVALDLLIRAATDTHLLTSLPSLPGKVFNPMIDQSSDTFITARKEALQLYLSQLLNNHKVSHYQDVLCFLGLHPVTGQSLRPFNVYSDSEVDQAV